MTPEHKPPKPTKPATLVVMILLALMGIGVGDKNPGVAYRAETPES
jgi:hypothetical protein